MLANSWSFLAQLTPYCNSSVVSSISALTFYSTIMDDDGDHINAVKSLVSGVHNLRINASGANIDVNGVVYSTDTVMVHELLKKHRLPYTPDTKPPGKFTWTGLRQIKNTRNHDNAAYQVPDGMATFYGALNYEYALSTETGKTKVIKHDVICFSPVILDAQSRDSSKSGTGVYGVDWWQVYIPLTLLKRITTDIKDATGYIVSDEGVITDSSQGLASVTVNCRNSEDSPKIIQIAVHKVTKDGVVIEDEEETKEETKEKLVYSDLGTMEELMTDGGEEDLIGGVGFFSIGVSCKYMAGAEPPPAGTMVKLSLKMKAFHALHIITSGVKRITYKSMGTGLEY